MTRNKCRHNSLDAITAMEDCETCRDFVAQRLTKCLNLATDAEKMQTRSDLERENEMLKQVIRSAHLCVKDYENDADLATHAKRHLYNSILEFDGPILKPSLLSNGDPSTLGSYLKIAKTYGTAAVAFIQRKINISINGKDEIVLAAEPQMKFILKNSSSEGKNYNGII